MATLEELLHPQVIFESITNRIKPMGNALQTFWGMQQGGPNMERTRFNFGSYDIFDSTREIASMRPENSPPASLPPQAIAQQPVKLARFHEKVPLYFHRLHALRQMARPSTQIDENGQQYITLQEGILQQRFVNANEFLVAGLMRGSAQFLASGDKWVPVFSGGTITVDFQIPSANKGNVNSIIATLWSDTVNAKVFQNLLDINAYSMELSGYPIAHAWCNSKVWGYITGNADLKSRAGTSNQMYDVFNRNPNATDAQAARDGFTAILKPIPWMTWHIYDGGLIMNGTFTKFFPDSGQGSCVLCPDPNPMIATMLRGTEHVAENELNAAVEREAPYFWPQFVREPAMYEIVGLELAMPALRIPKTMFPATVA